MNMFNKNFKCCRCQRESNAKVQMQKSETTTFLQPLVFKLVWYKTIKIKKKKAKQRNSGEKLNTCPHRNFHRS